MRRLFTSWHGFDSPKVKLSAVALRVNVKIDSLVAEVSKENRKIQENLPKVLELKASALLGAQN